MHPNNLHDRLQVGFAPLFTQSLCNLGLGGLQPLDGRHQVTEHSLLHVNGPGQRGFGVGLEGLA